MALGQQYCKQLRRHLTGLHANFPPNRPLALGDYGVKRDDVFQRLGNITQLGVQFAVIDGGAQSSIQFKTEGAVDVEFGAKGDVTPGGVPLVRAGLTIQFHRQDAVFFNAAGCVITQIDNLTALGDALIGLLQQGRWDSEFLVVTNLVRASHTTAVASARSGSEVTLEASSDALREIDLTDASLKLRTKRSRGTALEVVTASDQTPLMQLSRVRGVFSQDFRPESAAIAESSVAAPFLLSPAVDPEIPVVRDEGEFARAEAADQLAEVASAGEFRLDARASDFEIDRAKAAYIPLLEACYALADLQPIALPHGYEVIGEIRVSQAEMAEAAEADPPAVQEAIEHDFAAVEAAQVDASAFGFVIRETTTGAVLVCIRGTRTPREWLANFTAVPSEFNLVPGFGLVHLGFERMYRSVRSSILQALAGVPTGARITVLGHSLGGAMATLAAVDLKINSGRSHLDVCTFGAPRTGKVSFRRSFNREITRCFRLTNQFDVVPHVPSMVTGWNHVGEEIEVDGDVDSPHSLHAYLRGLHNLGELREVVLGPIPETVLLPQVVSLRTP